MGLTFFSFPVRCKCVFFVLTCISWGARMSQWWEQKPPTTVTRVQIPASTQYVRVSMGLTVSRRERLFFSVNLQKCTVILTVKTFQGIANLSIWADLHGLLAPEESLHLKNHWPCCQNILSEHYKTLQLCHVLTENIWIFYNNYVKGQGNLLNTTVKQQKLIFTLELNVY